MSCRCLLLFKCLNGTNSGIAVKGHRSGQQQGIVLRGYIRVPAVRPQLDNYNFTEHQGRGKESQNSEGKDKRGSERRIKQSIQGVEGTDRT